MPTLETTLIATETHEVKLKPSLQTKLRRELRVYAELTAQKKAIEHALEKHKAGIEAIREETGEPSLSLDGYSITLVAPVRKVFDAKKYVALGGDLDVYNRANVDTPSKPYTKISVPKEEED